MIVIEMNKPEILAIGEILIDFIPNKISTIRDLETFQRFPGGAPANVIVGLSRLGASTGFIGKIGNDPFGEYLTAILEKEKVDTTFLLKAKKDKRTALAFVYFDEDLDRDFFFYRSNAADIALEPKELHFDYFKKIQLLHFGSVSLTEEPARSATYKAIEYCKKNGGKTSFDPNIREDLWKSKEILLETVENALEKTDIFLPSENELRFLFSEQKFQLEKAIDNLFDRFPIEIIVVKKGNEGCVLKKRNGFLATIPSFEVEVNDSTGAGDGFNAGFLFGLWKKLSLEEAAIIGNAIGALVVGKKGAMKSLPVRKELEDFLKNQKIEIVLDE